MTTMQIDRAVVEQALEALEDAKALLNNKDRTTTMWFADEITALRAALAQQDEPEAYGYASRLAVAIWEKHYKDTAPQWKPLDDLMGVLTQIDNMTSGLTRLAQQAEPKPMSPEQRQRWEELAAMPQQAEPLNLSDRAVQRRLAAQWGYVPAAQAEPVEPVATLTAQRDALLEVLKSTGLFLHHCWCDVQMNDHSFEKLNRQMEIVDVAIKTVEETNATAIRARNNT